MTIYLFSGTPGSGKSAHAANEIRFCMNMLKLPVVANFELAEGAPVKDRSLFHFMPNEEFDVQQLITFSQDYWRQKGPEKFREDEILLVLDEMQLLANSRRWDKDANRMELLQFLSQHRKYAYKVILIAQSAKMIDNQFRMLVEYEVSHRKVANMGVIGMLIGLITFGRLYMYETIYYQINEHIGSRWYLMRKKDWRMYDSRATFGVLEPTS